MWCFAAARRHDRSRYLVSLSPILQPFTLGRVFQISPLPGGWMQPDTHLGPSSQPTRLCFLVSVCIYVSVCVWAAVFSGVLTAQLRLTDGIISHTDRKAGYRKPGCV